MVFRTDISMVVWDYKEHLSIWREVKCEELAISEFKMYFQGDAKYMKGDDTCRQACAVTHDCPVI